MPAYKFTKKNIRWNRVFKNVYRSSSFSFFKIIEVDYSGMTIKTHPFWECNLQ